MQNYDTVQQSPNMAHSSDQNIVPTDLNTMFSAPSLSPSFKHQNIVLLMSFNNTITNTAQQGQTIDLAQVKECIKLVNNALNKASKGGVYNIDEAYLIKVAMSNIEKVFEADEKKKDEIII